MDCDIVVSTNDNGSVLAINALLEHFISSNEDPPIDG
jgi:hypothetical protein